MLCFFQFWQNVRCHWAEAGHQLHYGESLCWHVPGQVGEWRDGYGHISTELWDRHQWRQRIQHSKQLLGVWFKLFCHLIWECHWEPLWLLQRHHVRHYVRLWRVRCWDWQRLARHQEYHSLNKHFHRWEWTLFINYWPSQNLSHPSPQLPFIFGWFKNRDKIMPYLLFDHLGRFSRTSCLWFSGDIIWNHFVSCNYKI